MKKRLKIILAMLFFGIIFQNAKAQVTAAATTAATSTDNGLQLSIRGGYDFPNFNNDTPYIDYKGGLELGASVDYYWKWFGMGADFDYIKNKPKSIYPTTNLFDSSGVPLTSFSLKEDPITRIFYGIGPDFIHRSASRKFTAELNTRIGLASIKGGETELRETSTLTNQLLNYHAGYNLSNVLSGKIQVRFNYFFSQNFGVNVGAYYLKHFKAEENYNGVLGISTGYQTFTNSSQVGNNMLTNNNLTRRVEPCNCDISSIGVFAGLTYRIPTKASAEKCCSTCPVYSLAVTARDKYTKELLPDTDVAVKNKNGEVVQTGKTNNFGVVVFNNMVPDDYTIEGLLYNVSLEKSSTLKSEFKPKITLQKEILYSDMNFILKGKTVVCNTSKPLDGVSVILKNDALAEQKNTVTDAKGEFVFNVKQKSTYEIYGRKANYFSQTETISTENYNRSTTLFVKLEVCMDEADCGKSIKLKNILYDLDKYEIKPLAKKELNRLVEFMQDNPDIKVEVSSHTDSRSSKEYNQTLSQNRANAAVDYVVSQGIARDRISGVGYGETRLLNNCADGVDCTEAQHQVNRRTEMKVICK